MVGHAGQQGIHHGQPSLESDCELVPVLS
jgi:hypothetical protein